MRKWAAWIGAMGLLVSACESGTTGLGDSGAAADSGPARDATVIADAQPSDSGPVDVGTADAGNQDAAPPDASRPDATVRDAGPLDCTKDSECPNGWCRETEDGGRACVPWAQEGEICGGFIAPWGVDRCDPSLTCFEVNPLLADAPGRCAVVTTFAMLARQPGVYHNHYIGLEEGYVVMSNITCSAIPCTDTMPCCNTCSADERFTESANSPPGSGVALESLNGAPFMCMGSECDYQDHCAIAPGHYRIAGWFVAGPPPTLRVDAYGALP